MTSRGRNRSRVASWVQLAERQKVNRGRDSTAFGRRGAGALGHPCTALQACAAPSRAPELNGARWLAVGQIDGTWVGPRRWTGGSRPQTSLLRGLSATAGLPAGRWYSGLGIAAGLSYSNLCDEMMELTGAGHGPGTKWHPCPSSCAFIDRKDQKESSTSTT